MYATMLINFNHLFTYYMFLFIFISYISTLFAQARKTCSIKGLAEDFRVGVALTFSQCAQIFLALHLIFDFGGALRIRCGAREI